MISIHTALAGCDAGVVAAVRWFTKISIHTALAGCDVTKLFGRSPAGIFQSTQPSQAVTQRPNIVLWYFLFQSTQPSQAVTLLPKLFCYVYQYFNPHSPRRL